MGRARSHASQTDGTIPMTRLAPLTAAVALLSAGCYSYQAVPLGPGAESSVLRLDLSEQGTAALTALVGPSAVRLEGHPLRMDDSTVTLGVTELVRRSGIPERWNGEPVRVARRDIAGTSARRFSTGRTVAAAVALVGGAILARAATNSSGEPATRVVTPPPPAQ